MGEDPEVRQCLSLLEWGASLSEHPRRGRACPAPLVRLGTSRVTTMRRSYSYAAVASEPEIDPATGSGPRRQRRNCDGATSRSSRPGPALPPQPR